MPFGRKIHIGVIINQWRSIHDMSKSTFANRAKIITPNYLKQIEDGILSPTLIELVAIEIATGLPIITREFTRHNYKADNGVFSILPAQMFHMFNRARNPKKGDTYLTHVIRNKDREAKRGFNIHVYDYNRSGNGWFIVSNEETFRFWPEDNILDIGEIEANILERTREVARAIINYNRDIEEEKEISRRRRNANSSPSEYRIRQREEDENQIEDTFCQDLENDTCPICKHKPLNDNICKLCGFDPNNDYDDSDVEKLKKEWQEKLNILEIKNRLSCSTDIDNKGGRKIIRLKLKKEKK